MASGFATEPGRVRLESLDALRGIAALAVAFFHFTRDLPVSRLTSLFDYGWLGVDVFFVISGYIIPASLFAAASYQFPRNYPVFLWKRILRLHPPYLASIAVVIGLWMLSAQIPGFRGEPPRLEPAELFAHLFLANDLAGLPWLNPVYWTLAIEFQFYLLIGVVFSSLARPKSRLPAILALILAGLIPVGHIWIFPFLPVFAMGILVFLHRRAGLATLPTIALLALASLVAVHSAGFPAAVAGVAAVLAILFWRARIHRTLIWFGTISYSLYLLHTVVGGRVINLAKRFPLHSIESQACAVCAALAISIFAAWLFHCTIERPAAGRASKVKWPGPALKPAEQNRQVL